jgi:hypothetical protein
MSGLDSGRHRAPNEQLSAVEVLEHFPKYRRHDTKFFLDSCDHVMGAGR